MKRLFVESSVFKKLIDGIENGDIERTIKNEILKDPSKGDIIIGTGGFRKIRVGKEGKGKSGGYRIIYFDASEYEVVYLYLLIDKSIKVDLTGKDKKWLMDQSQEIKRGLKYNLGSGGWKRRRTEE